MNPEDPILPPDDEAELEAEGAVEAEGVVEVESVLQVETFLEADAADDEGDDELPEPVPVAPPLAVAVTGAVREAAPARKAAAPRPDLTERREPLYRECRGYRLRLDPPDLARLRELAGSRGKSDEEIGEAFFDGQAERLAASIADDVPAPSEVRVVVDPYSRQAFLALENRIRGILSF